ncbi:MAG TPA: hypothetical protein ENK23_06490, partial [Sorangium sp.]|nr:hypothetical protein [Sorangium sp.]
TRISMTALERIEADHFDDLPGEVFTRGFLKAYAAAVGLVPNEVLARYTAARRAVAVEPLPLPTPVGRSGARRFGFAVAFVVLLVLFTLALSMVLRPRGNDRPPELSQCPPQAIPALGLPALGLPALGLPALVEPRSGPRAAA